MQSAMLVPEAAKLKKEALGGGYPNYEYGQSAVATFKQLLKAAQPDVEFVAEQAPPLGKLDAGSVVQALADAKPTRSSTCCSAPTCRSSCAKGNTRGLFQGRGGQPADRRARVPRPAEGRDAQRLDRHRLPLVRHPDARAQGLLPAYHRKYNDYPRLGSVVGYSTRSSRWRRACKKAKSTETEKMVAAFPGPGAHDALRQDDPFRPRGHQSTMGAFVGKTKNQGRQGRDGRLHLPRTRQPYGAPAPSDAEVKMRRCVQPQAAPLMRRPARPR